MDHNASRAKCHAGARPLERRVRLRSRTCRMCTKYLEVHMRTNIVIDDKLMADALKATGAKTKKEAVELGLRALLQMSRQAEVRRLRGKVQWQGDLDVMRRDK